MYCCSRVYPTLGCDIQGFQAMGLSVQYWPRWFQDLPAIWLAVPFGTNGAHLGICTLPEKIFFCVWNKLFRGEIKVFLKENSSCEVFMVTNCPYAGINKWMEKSNNFGNTCNGNCGNTMVKPQTVRCLSQNQRHIILTPSHDWWNKHRNFLNIPEFETYCWIQS